MTRQEMFNHVATKILEQGGPAWSVQGCVYRTADGKKCAAGWLIPDELYKTDMEGLRFHSYAWREMGLSQGLPEYLTSEDIFIRILQTAHDGATDDEQKGFGNFISRFKLRMSEIAGAYELNAMPN